MAPWELSPARVLPTAAAADPDVYVVDLERWRSEATASAAADIFSTGLALGDKSLVWEGGLRLLADESLVEERVIDIVKREIAPTPDLTDVRRNLAALEQDESYIRHSIRLYKSRLLQYPRNAILTLDLSRLYSILGQYEQAHHWLMRAYFLSPQNRLVLRALVQFHDIVGDLRSSLPYLWRSDALKFDPLIQSAEVAAAELSGRGSRAAMPLKKRLKGLASVPKTQSEAALALATLEQRNGVTERAVFKLVKAGLASPTENAVAQAVWVSDKSNRTLTYRFPNLEIQDDAFEARANLLRDARQYEAALRSAYQWASDQPFQAHPLAFICNCASIYTDAPARALRYADVIMARHATDWGAVNAALLVYNETKEIGKAQAAVDALSKLTTSTAEKAFASAGAGLLSFTTGHVDEAGRHYMDAIRFSRVSKRHDLTFTAATFYILGEARFARPDPKLLSSAIAHLDKALQRLDAVDQQQCARLWDRVKELVARSYENPRADVKSSGRPDILLIELPRLVEDI
ncbi:hypothetical protein [Sphingomonas sp. S2-65]|uniref:hypothetical protein n=1 Tax=Sphingomonas sp. S2-65 TaxID=2903960 RepID=UPI001F1B5457|nr:hypothetical protein [Sphingomonas sp. S2-65]UYY59514.1 hypothetical protein LZ586_05350 [Sphingomonas sp. S2-65]